MRGFLCGVCGSDQIEAVGEHQQRCRECGQESVVGAITAFTRVTALTEAERQESTRAFGEHMREVYQQLVRASFPGHALDERWTGARWLGGSAASDDGGVTEIGLGHGDNPMDRRAPQIRVGTRIAQPHATLDFVWAHLAQEHVQHLWHETGHHLDEAVRRAAFPRQAASGDATAPWDAANIPVDGSPLPFRILADEDLWVAQARHGDQILSIEARAWPIERTGLVTVRDFRPYLDGSVAMYERT